MIRESGSCAAKRVSPLSRSLHVHRVSFARASFPRRFVVFSPSRNVGIAARVIQRGATLRRLAPSEGALQVRNCAWVTSVFLCTFSESGICNSGIVVFRANFQLRKPRLQPQSTGLLPFVLIIPRLLDSRFPILPIFDSTRYIPVYCCLCRYLRRHR